MAGSDIINRHGFRSGWIIDSAGDPINEADQLVRGVSPFNEQVTARWYPQVTLNSAIPISERRDYTNVSNGGSVQKVDGEYRVRATATTNSRAEFFTRQRGNYISGGVLESGIGMRIPTDPTDDATAKWGWLEYDESEGINFALKSDGVYLQLTKNSNTPVDVPQQDWNIDKLDGTGASGATLSVSDGHVYQIPFVYYGYGDVIFSVMISVRGTQKIVPIHRVRRTEEVSINNPNLPLGVIVDSGTSGVQLDAFVGGRQISSTREDKVVQRSVGAFRANRSLTDTAWRPIISFRHRTGFENIFLTLTSVEVFTDSNIRLQIQRNATLDGNASFDYNENYRAGERATVWDVTAGNTFTNGFTIFETLASGGGGSKINLKAIDVPQRPVSEFDTISLVGRSLSGAASVDALFKVNEEW